MWEPYLALLVISSIPLIYAYKLNSFRKIEKYYWKSNKVLFWIYNICFFILSVSFAFNTRYVAGQLLKKYKWN